MPLHPLWEHSAELFKENVKNRTVFKLTGKSPVFP